jgi:hypothetical protein
VITSLLTRAMIVSTTSAAETVVEAAHTDRASAKDAGIRVDFLIRESYSILRM